MQSERNKPYRFILIDDNEIDLFFHDKLIKIKGLSDDISSFTSVQEVLEYLLPYENGDKEYPETVILLDIQMPELDGFDFIDHFEKLPEKIVGRTRIFIVSSSLDYGDLRRSHASPLIENILKKPLDGDELKKALDTTPFR